MYVSFNVVCELIVIGDMSFVCPFCKALKYSDESTESGCASGRVKFSQLIPPSTPLRSLGSWTGYA